MAVELDLVTGFKIHIAPRFDTMTHLNMEPAVREECLELLAKGGRVIMYGNHQSHADGWGLGAVVEDLRGSAKKANIVFPKVVLPLARSIFTGHQGELLKRAVLLAIPVLEEKGLKILPYTRKKDEEKYGLKRSTGELRAMVEAVKEGFNFCYLPEASIQPGRHRDFWGFFLGGERYGMIDVDDKNGFLGFHDLIRRFGKPEGEVFFLPVAMEGSYRFFGADIPIPTLELVHGLLREPTNPMQVTVERPITTTRLMREFRENWRDNGADLSDFLMSQVAYKLPPSSRGVFGIKD